MGNVHMEAAQVNYRGGSKKMSVEEAIKNAGSEITPEEKTWIDSIPTLTASNAGKTDQTVIAPEFDAEAGTYEIGDKVMYEGKLYKFTSAHETPGDWDSSEVSETTVADDLSSLESGLINAESRVVYEAGSLSFGVVDVGETKHMRVTLPAKTGYTLASANGHLSYADSAVVSCQITDDTTLDVYATNTQSFALADQTLVYSLIYVKTSV